MTAHGATTPSDARCRAARQELAQARATHEWFWTVLVLKLRELLLRPDVVWAEQFSALLGTGIGAWLLMPWTTFGLGPGTAAMGAFLPEATWGGIMFVGAGQAFVACVHGSPRWRQIAAAGGVVTWMFWSGFFVSANPHGLGALLFPYLALNAIWAYARLGMMHGWPWTHRRSGG